MSTQDQSGRDSQGHDWSGQDWPGLTFTGHGIDRADHVRSDPERLAQSWADPRAQLILLDGLDPRPESDGTLRMGPVPQDGELTNHVLLGLRDGAPLFVSLTVNLPVEAPGIPPATRSLIPQLNDADAALYGGARSLVDWHDRHQFCAKCGGSTVPVKAGWSRRCDGCRAEHFPRVDPVVIMLAEYEGKVLLGRNSRFPPGRFSALAGFVEPGESVEEAVRRETLEEAGVRVGRVDYMMSQPWPFPSQLMIACMGQALDDELTIDTNELAEAIWVSKQDVRDALAEKEGALFLPPPPIAVAHHMLRHWLGE